MHSAIINVIQFQLFQGRHFLRSNYVIIWKYKAFITEACKNRRQYIVMLSVFGISNTCDTCINMRMVRVQVHFLWLPLSWDIGKAHLMYKQIYSIEFLKIGQVNIWSFVFVCFGLIWFLHHTQTLINHLKTSLLRWTALRC